MLLSISPVPFIHTAQKTLQTAIVGLQEAETVKKWLTRGQKDFPEVMLKLGPQPGTTIKKIKDMIKSFLFLSIPTTTQTLHKTYLN